MAVRIPQPGSQASQQIVVWEERPWWTPRLQRRFAGSEVAVRPNHGALEVNGSPPEVVVFDVSGDPAGAVRGVSGIRQRGGGVFIIVIVPSDLRGAEWRLRDIGADVVVTDDVSGDDLTRICRHALRTGQHSTKSY